MSDFILCGWRVRSELALPELLPWQGDDRPVDVEISVGQIIKPVEAPLFVRPHWALWSNSGYFLEIEGVGRFWVEHGRRVLVEPAPGVAGSELGAFILGTILGVLCHQRGLLPIHASAVNINGRAVLVAGDSGAGKSTLAAALGECGHALVADDIVAITPDGLVLPAFPQRKLCSDVLEALALDNSGLLPNRPGQPKYRVPALAGFTAAPLPPSSIYILDRAMPGQPCEIVRQDAMASVAWLNKMIYRRGIGMKIRTPQATLRTIARLLQAAPVHLLSFESGRPLSNLGELAGRVEAHALGRCSG